MPKGKISLPGEVLIIIAGIFWGSMGIFVRRLTELGFSSSQTVCLRLTGTAVIFVLILLLFFPGSFAVRPRDLPFFALMGLGSIVFFTVCYFSAINMMSIATAAILLYTSPVWVMLMALVFFKEKITGFKLCAMVLAFCGCALISGTGGGLTLPGLLVGLGAGIGYALYSILGTVALRKYKPLTVTTWTFIFAAAGSWLICKPAELISLVSQAPGSLGLLLFCLTMSLITAVIPFSCYTLGLKSTPAGKAAVLATVEPLSAALMGLAVFGEKLSLGAVAGIMLILAAIVLLSLKNK